MRKKYETAAWCVPIACLLLAVWAGGSSAQDFTKDIDVWINVTLQNLPSSQLNMSGINQTLLLSRIAELAASGGPYVDLANAVIRSVETQLGDGSVQVSACLVGSYTDAGSGVCMPCPAGTFSSTSSATSSAVCVQCQIGTYSVRQGANSSSTCVSCPNGTFSGSTGASSLSACQSCQAGATTKIGGAVITGATSLDSCVCKDGYYLHPTRKTCDFCPVGYFCSSNKITACPQQDPFGIGTSNAGSSALEQCFCSPGYYNRPLGEVVTVNGVENILCQACLNDKYCPGVIQADGNAAMYACPGNSKTAGRGAQSLAECVCSASYRTQVSDRATRTFQLNATRCMCSVGADEQCPAGVGCDGGCTADTTCGTEIGVAKTLTCPQGYLNLVTSAANYGKNDMGKTWIIAPSTGSSSVTGVWVRFSGFNTKVGDKVTISQCRNTSVCVPGVPSAGVKVIRALDGDFTYAGMPSVKTDAGWPVMMVEWIAPLGGNPGWQLNYGSNLSCVSETIPLSAVSVQYIATQELEVYVRQPELSWPVVVWLSDILSFSTPESSEYARVDVWSGSPTSGVSALRSGGLGSWIPQALGTYYIVDLSMPATRYRKLVVVPIDPTRWVVYYNVESAQVGMSTVTSFTLTLNGAATTGSQDIVLTAGDTLVLSRMSPTHGAMLLKSYTPAIPGNASSTASWQLVTEGVVGQSAPGGELSPFLTWDTANAAPGVYYVASAVSVAGVRMVRVVVAPRPGGQKCVLCKIGEYCYNGNPLQCPANSNSPPGSTGQENCTCTAGYAREVTDMATYVNSQTVDSGGRHSCVVTNDGSLWCWGANDAYQLGLSYASPYVALPQKVSISGVLNVSLGDDFTCVVLGAGLKTRCWGGNFYGQLGLDSAMDNSGGTLPSACADVKLEGDAGVYSTRFLSCGGQSCCAIVLRGAAPNSVLAVSCWGRGDTGQLGQGGTTTKRSNIGTGAGASTGISETSDRYSFAAMGSTDSRPSFTVSLTPVALSMGGAHACLLAVEGGGSVHCWGQNKYGALGGGLPQEIIFNPVAVTLPGRAKTVNCYAFVCCVLMAGTFEVKCWGRGGGGRLGVGIYDVGKTASSMGANLQSVALGTAQYAIDVNVGATQTCALLGNNHVKCWGLVGGNILGDNPPADMFDLLPSLQVNGGRVAIQVAGKGGTTCAVLSDYRVACWGNNDWRQLGGAVSAAATVANQVSVVLTNMTMVNLTDGVEALRSSGAPQSLVCTQCGKNQYCDGGGGPAARCPNDTTTVQEVLSTRLDDCRCLQGFTSVSINNGASFMCRQCSGVEFCSAGALFSCPLQSTTLAAASYSQSQCRCVPGYYGDDGTACAACGVGKYKDKYGSGECTLCPAGTFSGVEGLSNASGCAPCPGGSYSGAGAFACIKCDPGKAAKTGANSCASCGAGFFASDNAEGCQACPVGTFDEAPYGGLNDTCTRCSKGTASAALNATNASTCKWCPAGTMSGAGAGACSACAAGEYSDGGTEACSACPANSNSAPGSAYGRCVCNAGFYKDFSRAGNGYTFECTSCGQGRWSAGNVSACTLCAAGTASQAVGAANGGVCEACAAGKYSSNGSSQCLGCPAWSYAADAGQSSCLNCSLGDWAPANATVCTPCLPGYYSLSAIPSIAGCLRCPRGSYCVGSSEAKASSVPQVQSCPPGSYVGANTNGLSAVGQCGDCVEGSYCPTPTMVNKCPEGTTSPIRSSSQLQCSCQDGFVCSYTKVVNAVINLKMTLAQFGMKEVQTAFKSAVAAASKTDPANVQILGYKTVTTVGGGARRLLGLEMTVGGEDRDLIQDGVPSPVQEWGVGSEAGVGGVDGGVLNVFLEVRGGGSDGLDGLDGHLVRAGLDPSLDHAWYSPHAVEARAIQ